MKNEASSEGLFSRSRGPGGWCNSHGSSCETSWGRCCFSREGLAGSQSGLPRVTRPVGSGAGFRQRPADAGPRSVWDVAPAGRRASSTSGPRLVHGLASVSLHPERGPGPGAAPSALPFRVPRAL